MYEHIMIGTMLCCNSVLHVSAMLIYISHSGGIYHDNYHIVYNNYDVQYKCNFVTGKY